MVDGKLRYPLLVLCLCLQQCVKRRKRKRERESILIMGLTSFSLSFSLYVFRFVCASPEGVDGVGRRAEMASSSFFPWETKATVDGFWVVLGAVVLVELFLLHKNLYSNKENFSRIFYCRRASHLFIWT